MRIGLNLLYIIPGQNGGTQTYAGSLLKALAALDQGDEFFVFVSREGAALELPAQPNFRKVVCPVRAVRREMRYAYEQIVFPWLLRRYKLDVLHSLGYVCPLYPPSRSVVTIHDLNYLTAWHGMSRQKRLFLGWFVTQSARRADLVLTVSEFSKREIVRHLQVPEAKVTVTLEGPREASPLPADRWENIAARYRIDGPYLMAFGSLTENKNIIGLLRAFARIHAQVPHSLLLVGHIAPGAVLQEEIVALGIADRIKITGFVPEEHVMPLLEHADLFVFPSLYEGFGLPALDAQRAGVAVACSDAASLPEVAGEGAAFFDPASVEDMSQVLLDCLRDSTRRSALIQQGRANVARFSWQQTAAATLEVYRQGKGTQGKGTQGKGTSMENEQDHLERELREHDLLAEGLPGWLVNKPDEFNRINRDSENFMLRQMFERRKFIEDKHGPAESIFFVGAGSGMEAEPFARAGYAVSLSDLSPNILRCAEQRFQERGLPAKEFFTANAQDLPLEDNSYSIGVAYEALHHVPQPVQALRELARVSSQGIIFVEPFTSPLFDALSRFGLAHRQEYSGLVPYRFQKIELDALLSEFGFESRRLTLYLRFPDDYLPKALRDVGWFSHIYQRIMGLARFFPALGNQAIVVAVKPVKHQD